MKHFMHLVALWKPPQHVVDGKLHAEQPYIETAMLKHVVSLREYNVRLFIWDAELKAKIFIEASFTEDLVAEKRAAFGHHLVTTLGRLHAQEKAILAGLIRRNKESEQEPAELAVSPSTSQPS